MNGLSYKHLLLSLMMACTVSVLPAAVPITCMDTVVVPLPMDSVIIPVDAVCDTISPTTPDSTSEYIAKRRPWLAVAEVIGFNVGLLAIDRFVLNGDYAHVSMKSFRRNIGLGHWFWDSDKMYTNLFSHPYHGNMYYNAARSNGMNYYVSMLYSTAGSLLWEIGGENEWLSVNDFLSTSIGGAAIGETAYRLSDAILDDTQRGGSRFLREAVAFVINPMRGFTRLIHGDSWRQRKERVTFLPQHLMVDVSTGIRLLHTSAQKKANMQTAFVGLDIEYGDVVQTVVDHKPFSYFRFASTMAMGQHQPLVNNIGLVGRVASTQITEGKVACEVGLYQHFNYMETDAGRINVMPYKLAETVSVGAGIQYTTDTDRYVIMRGGFYANAMVLGGMMSDIQHDFINRNYNVGSGFTLRYHTTCEMGRLLRLRLTAEYYRLYTWIDCSEINFNRDAASWSTQGDEGVSGLLAVKSNVNIRLWKKWGLYVGANYFNRHAHYKFHPAQSPSHSHTFEWLLGVSKGL